ncbi:MAG: hypothetical protein PHS93_08700 [Candidatus Omnitrophica bacterium]|nr:hypothetical protein [Candidatus Omnitrophota bacterium]
MTTKMSGYCKHCHKPISLCGYTGFWYHETPTGSIKVCADGHHLAEPTETIDFEGKELFDDIIENPFKYLNKVAVNVRYHVFTTDTGPIGAFNGVIESVRRDKMSNLDTIVIQSPARQLKVQRWAVMMIEIDPEWQKRKDEYDHTIQALQSLSNRIFKVEGKLKALSD